MTATNHVLTGALIAVTVDRPLLAIVLAFISHYVLDSLPQFGLSDIPEAERDSNQKFVIFVGFDSYITLGLFWLMPFLLQGHANPLTVFACMAAAQVPDAVWFIRHMRANRHGAYHEQHWTTRFHKFIQWCERSWGVYVELIYLTSIIVLLRLTTL